MNIYKITNKINGLQYVGQTIKSVATRWKQHQSPDSTCRFLKHAIRKYGASNFEVELLEKCSSIEEMNEKEQFYIDSLNTMVPNGYNLNSGGKNRLASHETKNKMSKSQKGIKKPKTVEHRIKISRALKGSKHSEEVKTRRAKAAFKPIFVPELNTTFESIKETIKAVKAPGPMAIHRVLRGERPNWRGLTFQYATKEF